MSALGTYFVMVFGTPDRESEPDIRLWRGRPALGDIGLTDLSQAHGRWRLTDSRLLGSDRLDVYERVREG